MLERVPGSPNDPVTPFLDQVLAVRTPRGFSIEGDDAPLLLDGFQLRPRQGDGSSSVTGPAIERLALQLDGDAMYGENGTLELATAKRFPAGGELSTREAALYLRTAVIRLDLLGFAIPHLVPAERELAFERAPTALGAQWHVAGQPTRNLGVEANALFSVGGTTFYTDRAEHADQRVEVRTRQLRFTVGEHYDHGPWRAELVQSFGQTETSRDRGVVQRETRNVLAFETREQVRRRIGNVAGLTRFTWLIGGEAHIARHDLDLVGAPEDRENVARPSDRLIEGPFDDASHVFRGVVWRPDAAASTGFTAHLSARLSAYLGARIDAFGTDLALEPRAQLRAELDDQRYAMLVAGAYRRPPEQGDELEHELHPERTSRVALELGQARGSEDRGLAGVVQLYYDDRTRLIERDGFGELANTGNGTTYGVFALASEHVGHWLGQLSIRIEHSERQDAYRERIRPYEYDQPLRLDARLQRRCGAWMAGAHFSLRDGLPSTPVLDATFDADRDVYLPRFGTLYTERLPWQQQLDLRIDRELTAGRVHLTAYLDVANVYDHRSTIGWAYNFNYTQKRAIQDMPILPTLGIRGQL